MYSLKKSFSIFGADFNESQAAWTALGITKKSIDSGDLASIGSKFGFFKKPDRPIAASIFVTKGGVLKTSLTLNLARTAALHGLKVCVVGLDMQGDITQALGNEGPDENESLEEALRTLNSLRGLSDFFVGQSKLEDIIVDTEVPGLSFIPETPELVALDQSLLTRNRREYWLLENVVNPLKQRFDLILMDCSPNWNRLINNALVASDVLLSPVECKINNFRNLRTFRALIAEYRRDMRLEFDHVFIPTRVVGSRRLSREIFDWYRQNLNNCTRMSIRESVHGEEATALRLSIAEHSPVSAPAAEMRLLLAEIGEALGISVTSEDRLLLDQAKLGGSPIGSPIGSPSESPDLAIETPVIEDTRSPHMET